MHWKLSNQQGSCPGFHLFASSRAVYVGWEEKRAIICCVDLPPFLFLPQETLYFWRCSTLTSPCSRSFLRALPCTVEGLCASVVPTPRCVPAKPGCTCTSWMMIQRRWVMPCCGWLGLYSSTVLVAYCYLSPYFSALPTSSHHFSRFSYSCSFGPHTPLFLLTFPVFPFQWYYHPIDVSKASKGKMAGPRIPKPVQVRWVETEALIELLYNRGDKAAFLEKPPSNPAYSVLGFSISRIREGGICNILDSSPPPFQWIWSRFPSWYIFCRRFQDC